MPQFQGKVVDPRLVPEQAKAEYSAAWKRWFKENPLYREGWMMDLLKEAEHKRRHST